MFDKFFVQIWREIAYERDCYCDYRLGIKRRERAEDFHRTGILSLAHSSRFIREERELTKKMP